MTETKSCPTEVYYREAQGRWRGDMNVHISSFAQLRRTLGFLNAMSLWMVANWPRFLGAFSLETTVTCLAQQKVEHTTTIFWGRFAMMRSIERLSLHDDGHRFHLTGETRMTLAPWQHYTMAGEGEVDHTATHATYELNWLGTTLKQTTTRTTKQTTLVQEAPGFHSSQVLKEAG